MADETTTQQVTVQPTQQRVINTDSITLKGTEVYGKMRPFSANPRDYKSTSMEGEQYYLYRFMGTIITVPADFHRDYQEFDVLEVTLTGAPRDVEKADPNSPGGKKMETVQSYGFDSHVNTKTEIAMLKIQKHKATIQRAKKAIDKIDVSKELTAEELADLIG
jgi:hypothetical protein